LDEPSISGVELKADEPETKKRQVNHKKRRKKKKKRSGQRDGPRCSKSVAFGNDRQATDEESVAVVIQLALRCGRRTTADSNWS
jgi:ribosome assembly protein YihI (activator of Der GTPase)